MSYHQQTFVVLIYVSLAVVSAVIVKTGTTAATNNTPTTTATSTIKATPNALHFTQANAINNTQLLKDTPQKRNVELGTAHDSRSAATSVKSYEPPPEYYRGPTTATLAAGHSTGSSGGYAATVSALPNAADFLSKSNTIERSRYGSLDGGGNGWSYSKGISAGLGKQGFNDRISVGHYGSVGHGGGGGGSVGYETARPYIEPEHFDYAGGGGSGSHHHIHYPPIGAAQHGVSTAPGYYAASGHGGGGGIHDSGPGIHFDVYGAKGGGSGGGGGSAVEYSPYPSYAELHEPASHKGHHGELSPKALLAKSFLIPLASAAVLGIAAALVSNPLLLQLGTVSAALPPAVVGRRRRRDLRRTGTTTATNAEQGESMEHAQTLAYRTHHIT